MKPLSTSKAESLVLLTVDNVTMAPDGVERLMMVYNNSYPGPLLTANWGDLVTGQAERTNQIIETSLRCMIAGDVSKYPLWTDY